MKEFQIFCDIKGIRPVGKIHASTAAEALAIAKAKGLSPYPIVGDATADEQPREEWRPISAYERRPEKTLRGPAAWRQRRA